MTEVRYVFHFELYVWMQQQFDDVSDDGDDDDVVERQVSKKNLMEIVKKLMVHMDKAEGSHYRDELLSKIIEICSQSNYQFITNFEWY